MTAGFQVQENIADASAMQGFFLRPMAEFPYESIWIIISGLGKYQCNFWVHDGYEFLHRLRQCSS